MSVLSAVNLSQSYGFVDVFTGLSVSVAHGAKIGLVGPNGIGKTTLLKLLFGLEEPSWGEVHVAKGVRLGYLRQEAMEAFANDANTVHEEMLAAFSHVHRIERRMRELEEAMAGVGTHPSTAPSPLRDSGSAQDATDRSKEHGELKAATDPLKEYGELQEQFAHLGGYDIETNIAQTLDGLGFRRDSWGTQVQRLSGGQKTRALLARLLLERPDVLILDEPTNHLDIDAIEWLEKTLREWKGAVIVSSHDRFFLDRVVTTIWDMGRARVDVYRGNYTAYTQQREERFQRSLFVFHQEKARLEKEMAYIKANAPGEPSVQSRGKLKRLTRDVVTIERLGAEVLVNENWSDIATKVGYVPFPFGVEEAEKRVANLRPPTQPTKVELRLKAARRSGEMVLRTFGLEVGYRAGERESDAHRTPHAVHRLFVCDDLFLTWKDRAALIGPNGAGKTSFIRTALGQIEPLAGRAELGSSLNIAYFAQAHEELNPGRIVIEELKERAPDRMSDGEARHYLAQFLFRNDDVFKPVGGLSGGEKARLALAILQLKGANFLVLDEPTNHLDILSQEVLQEALSQFNGTLMLVSHDRYLIDTLATQMWWIHEGRLRAFRGTYAEWTKWREKALSPARRGLAEGRRGGGRSSAAHPAKAADLAPPTEERQSKAKKSADRKRQQQIDEAEARVASLEARLKDLSDAMQRNRGADEVTALGIEYALTQRELDEAMKHWEAVAT
jgi:ATP-binding cassette subfamily F protein 3